MTFDRKSIIFKSYYFELFSKPRYTKNLLGRKYGPVNKDIIETEIKLINFIIDKNIEEFSLDLFKREYEFYCRDLCDLTEEGFIDYLFSYFNDIGLPAFAETVKESGKHGLLNDLMDDMKTAFKANIYTELIENSFHYAPPYLLLNNFIQHTKKWPLRYFSVPEWYDVEIKKAFITYSSEQFKYPDNFIIEKKINIIVSKSRI